ncbi:MAG: 2,3-bisphosphoglycerate-independent phosphoglycerate mutase, partial [Candidatus Bathyarchaeota archaeon]
MKKILYIILDGLGDRPHPDLDGKTPLEAADIPNIDSLAKRGKMGLVHTVKEGVAPESDVAVMSLLGYDAEKYYPGRGPLETQGAGMEMSTGDLALRGNFATGTSEDIIINRRVARSLETSEGEELARAVNESVELVSDRSTFKLVSTIGYRNVLVIKRSSGNLSGNISNTDPAYDRISTYSIAKEEFEMKVRESRPLEENEEARIAAELVNEFTEKSKKILSTHPINIRRTREGKLPANLILLRDAGSQKPLLPKITDLYGVEFGCLVELPVEKGIAELSGMEVFSIPLVENTLSEHYKNMAQTTVSTLKRKEGVYVHIKGPDEPGHDGLAKKKQKIIEDIDKYFFSNILGDLDLNEVVVAITSDHSTPCILKAHSS